MTEPEKPAAVTPITYFYREPRKGEPPCYVMATEADIAAAGYTSNAECARVLNDLQQAHVRELSDKWQELERLKAMVLERDEKLSEHIQANEALMVANKSLAEARRFAEGESYENKRLAEVIQRELDDAERVSTEQRERARRAEAAAEKMADTPLRSEAVANSELARITKERDVFRGAWNGLEHWSLNCGPGANERHQLRAQLRDLTAANADLLQEREANSALNLTCILGQLRDITAERDALLEFEPLARLFVDCSWLPMKYERDLRGVLVRLDAARRQPSPTSKQDPGPSGQNAETNDERNRPSINTVTATQGSEPSINGLAGRAPVAAGDDRRPESSAEEPRTSAGHHEAGGSAAVGRRSDEGGVEQHIVDKFSAEFGCTIRDCLDCGCLVPGGPTRCRRCAGTTSATGEAKPANQGSVSATLNKDHSYIGPDGAKWTVRGGSLEDFKRAATAQKPAFTVGQSCHPKLGYIQGCESELLRIRDQSALVRAWKGKPDSYQYWLGLNELEHGPAPREPADPAPSNPHSGSPLSSAYTPEEWAHVTSTERDGSPPSTPRDLRADLIAALRVLTESCRYAPSTSVSKFAEMLADELAEEEGVAR